MPGFPFVVLIGILGMLAVGPLSPAEAVQCGDGVTSDVTLTGDLDCSGYEKSPVLKVTAPVTLNLNGFKVIGNGQIGILIDTEGAKVLDGTVTNCSSAVAIESGHNDNEIWNVTAVKNTERAFRIRSNNNFITECVSMSNGDHGFDIRGQNNWVSRCKSTRNGILPKQAQGFHFEGSGHRAVENYAAGNTGGGFQINEGASGLTLINNSSLNNKGQGFLLKTTALDNVMYGNFASKNALDGILVEDGATGNIIFHNVAWRNGDRHTTFDLSDGSGKCDDNKWTRDWFRTRNTDCIK